MTVTRVLLLILPCLQTLRDKSAQGCPDDASCYARYEEPCQDDWEFQSKYRHSAFKPIISKIKKFTSTCVHKDDPKPKMWTLRDDLNCGTSEWVIDVAQDPTNPQDVYKWKSQVAVAGDDAAVCTALLREKATACNLLDKSTDIAGWNMYAACEKRVADKSPFTDADAADRQKTLASFASAKDLPDETGAPCDAQERCYVKYSETSPCDDDWQLRNKHAVSMESSPIISYVKKYETKCLKKLGQLDAVGRGRRNFEGWVKRPDLADTCGQSGLVVQAAKNPEGPAEVFALAWKSDAEASAEVCAELMKKKDEFCYLLPRETDAMGWNMFKKCITKSN